MRTPPTPPQPTSVQHGVGAHSATYSDAIGTMQYTLYRSSTLRKQPPLFLMLHGGGQSASDFAEETRMHEVIQQSGGMALFPEQSRGAHPLRCWNWYHGQHQVADRGEPAMLAGLTRFIIDQHGVDRRRVYVAGMSAGGAMAAILGQAYPNLYAAVGVHSGLRTGIAHDLLSALRVMNGGPPVRGAPEQGAGAPGLHGVPTIVFHGDRDHTVHPDNAAAVIDQALGPPCGADERHRRPPTQTTVAGDHEVTLMKHARRPGRPDAELWLVHGAGHRWTGGNEKGGALNARQPGASSEMLRFFLTQALTRRQTRAMPGADRAASR